MLIRRRFRDEEGIQALLRILNKEVAAWSVDVCLYLVQSPGAVFSLPLSTTAIVHDAKGTHNQRQSNLSDDPA